MPCGAALLTPELLLFLGWAVELGKLYSMRKYMEELRRRNEDTAATAAMKMNIFDAAQEEGVAQQRSEKTSALPKMFQGETSYKKSPPKN